MITSVRTVSAALSILTSRTLFPIKPCQARPNSRNLNVISLLLPYGERHFSVINL